MMGSEEVNPELDSFARESGKPLLDYHNSDTYLDAYNDFYDSLLNNKKD
jgi:starch synthase